MAAEPSERSSLLPVGGDREDDQDQPSSSETAPLLAPQGDGDEAALQESSVSSSPSQAGRSSGSGWRWPSLIAGVVMVALVIAVLLCGFLLPGAVKVYAENAAVLEPRSLSVESITNDGVRARIRAEFHLDGSRVSDPHARRIGRFTTGIMRYLSTEETRVSVYAPGYDDSLLGSVAVPPLTVSIVDGHSTLLDIVADLVPGDVDNIRRIANSWLDGKLDNLKLTGSTSITLKSGFIPLGSHDVVESMVFEASKIPSLPEHKIERLSFHEVPLGRGGQQAIGANVTLSAHNDYPVGLDVPPLSFEILLANCDDSDSYIAVAEAITDPVEVQPEADVYAAALGIIRKIPEPLTRSCPDSNTSPLDHFMHRYLHGEDAQIWVRGARSNGSDTPEWIVSILEDMMVPVGFPGKSFGDVIRNFTAEDVDFQMPSPFADPGDPDGVPRVSGTIMVVAALPEEFDLEMGVGNIRCDADLYYEGDKLGELNMSKWVGANSTRIVGDDDSGETLIMISSHVDKVPLSITDNSVFAEVLQEMLFGDEDVLLQVQASVDVKVGTVLGNLPLKGVPANGTIPVKHLPKSMYNALEPQVDELRILNTSDTGTWMQARVNFTNPFPYTASIPRLNVHLLGQDTVLGSATATDINLRLGNNTGHYIEAIWDPILLGNDPDSDSEPARDRARRWLSDYVSGKNTTLEVRTHAGTFPTMPLLGQALSGLNLTVPTPHLGLPGGDHGGGGGTPPTGDGHFVRDATFHLLSSTATFTLASPLHGTTVYLDRIDARAFYNSTEPVGRILTTNPFSVPPGLSTSPKLPVYLSPGGIGYDKLRGALGGKLDLDCVANVSIRIGQWTEWVEYTGSGVGAKVRL
ncbi:hypothetical protein GMORB2_5528 [Geosmithia morbida]|uniref:Uncharacterized protein n=1 Tax=Geosmithia morbida TaxID=1094350 RepID=A0A9P5D2F6_9HYPO|nr:uncharacterized protein GMORB2_5528 [Geosmithia morbida]KAF4123812.1 hypothetical protein GMORB2_5528 [Geosmithia morbida]